MARFLSSLFGKPPTTPPASSLRISTSLQGVPITLLLGGAQRLGFNLIDYFGFQSRQQAAPGAGGKGGVTGGGGKGQQQTAYSVSFIGSICEGPIAGLTKNWINGSSATTFAGEEDVFLGNYTQTPWSFLGPAPLDPLNPFPESFPVFSVAFLSFISTLSPTQQAAVASRALAYRGLAYVASPNYDLGTSPSLPQFNFEIVSTNSNNFVPGQVDGDPTISWTMFLADSHFGIGFPTARMGPIAGFPSSWQSYCKALGFGVSPAVAGQVQASAFLNDLTSATNSAPCWQNGQLIVAPYGDQPVTQGSVTTITETHIIGSTTPTGGVPTANPITVGNVGTFVTDLGVSYFAGSPFTLTTSFPPGVAGTYFQANGIYYFSNADIGQTVSITYTFATAASYVPDTVPLYDFSIDDYLSNQGTIGTGLGSTNSPVIVVRKSRDQMNNIVKVEYLDRNNDYNPVNIELKDSASIFAFGRARPTDIKQLHMFCLASAAVQSATLMLAREQIPRTFQWTVGKHFMLILELMKIVTLSSSTGSSLQLFRQPVRIIEIQENSDQSLTITGEEFPGTAAAPLYGTEFAAGVIANYNIDPGGVNPPLLFEPTDELGRALISGGGLMVAVALSGVQANIWGGAQVWTSYDGNKYQNVGTITGASRMGVLTAPLAAVLVNQTGQTIDQASTLSVDLTESFGALNSGTQLDATSLNTKCFVGPFLGTSGAGSGEMVSYATATLASQFHYNLTFLVRGAFGTEDEIATWPTGTGFARIDDTIFTIPFDKTRIGATLFIKFVSFNVYKGGGQSLADVPAFSYVIQGSALASPLPTLENVRTVFVNNRLGVSWDEITDFRGAIRVEIRRGNTFDTSQILGTVAHPPFILPGDGTYWFTAWCQPAAALIVRSEAPVSITASGVTLTSNLLAQFDCKANNWVNGQPGKTATFVNTSIDVGVNAVRLNGGQMQTTAPTPAGGNVLTFAQVPTGVTPGISVTDINDSGVIPAGTTVLSTTLTTVTMSNPVGSDFWPGDFPPADFGSRGVLTGDVIQFGTTQILTTTGTYAPPFSIDVGRPVNVSITISLSATGVAVGQNILSDINILGDADVLGSENTKFIDVFPIVNVSSDGITFTPIKYAPGDFFGRFFNFTFSLNTLDPSTVPELLTAVISAQVPTRIDHVLTNQPLSAAGLAISFTPDGSGTPAPFNGGPNGATVPHVLATWGDQQAGDSFVINNLSLSGATFQITNGGVGVTRNKVNILVEGF